MASYHTHLSYTSKGQVRGGAAGFHAYLDRAGVQEGAQFHRYLVREGKHGKDDLVDRGHGHLPLWAQNDPARFWQEADRLERAVGPVFWHLQVTLPRELSGEGRLDLARDITEVVAEHYPHSWEVHCPVAADGGEQPHLHLQFSSRREDEPRDISAEQWFKQPNHGGTAKDKSWFQKSRLYDLREGIALLANAALAREGHEVAVTHQSLKDRGIARETFEYGKYAPDNVEQMSPAERKQWRAEEKALMLSLRNLHTNSGAKAYEALKTYEGWKDQAVQFLSLDREYVKDLTKAHIWRHDKSPVRREEREQAMRRQFTLAAQSHGPLPALRQQAPQRQRQPPTRSRVQSLRQDLETLMRELGQGEEEHVGGHGGVRVRLWEEERERQQHQGMGW